MTSASPLRHWLASRSGWSTGDEAALVASPYVWSVSGCPRPDQKLTHPPGLARRSPDACVGRGPGCSRQSSCCSDGPDHLSPSGGTSADARSGTVSSCETERGGAGLGMGSFGAVDTRVACAAEGSRVRAGTRVVMRTVVVSVGPGGVVVARRKCPLARSWRERSKLLESGLKLGV